MARRRILKPILANVKSACDLACGSGTTAIALSRRGIQVYAVDLSPTMCRLARRKTAGLQVKVIRGDMRTFKLPEPVDLVTCECDAVNHIARKSDLRRVAKAVARALRPGGHFYFDVNNALGFATYWTGTHWTEKPGIVMVMNNGHNRTRAWSEVNWFIQDGLGWRRFQERVEEVCWPAQEIEETLHAAGFDQIQHWDATPFFLKTDSRVTPGCRSIYLARKAS